MNEIVRNLGEDQNPQTGPGIQGLFGSYRH